MVPEGFTGPKWGKPFSPVFVLEKQIFKIFFSRSSSPISIMLDTNHPRIKVNSS
jgi:hypothetical protein